MQAPLPVTPGRSCPVGYRYDPTVFDRVDLRVDIHDEPVGELRRIFDLWSKAMDYYWGRQVDPRVEPLFEAVPDPNF